MVGTMKQVLGTQQAGAAQGGGHAVLVVADRDAGLGRQLGLPIHAQLLTPGRALV